MYEGNDMLLTRLATEDGLADWAGHDPRRPSDLHAGWAELLDAVVAQDRIPEHAVVHLEYGVEVVRGAT